MMTERQSHRAEHQAIGMVSLRLSDVLTATKPWSYDSVSIGCVGFDLFKGVTALSLSGLFTVAGPPNRAWLDIMKFLQLHKTLPTSVLHAINFGLSIAGTGAAKESTVVTLSFKQWFNKLSRSKEIYRYDQ